MSQTTETKRIHYTKAYKIDPFTSTEFEAQIGNIKGLYDSVYIIIDHTKRITGKVKYKTLIVDDGEEFDIKKYKYVGTFIGGKSGEPRIKHVYITTIDESGYEEIWEIPR